VRIFFIILILILSFNPAWSQTNNYQDIFSDDWNKALLFEKENRSWMEPLLIKYHLSYPLAVAVIFPELVRYSALRDKMEITLLKVLYINLGQDYANFSIGRFQMKPSFAEMIREQAPAVLRLRSGIQFKSRSEYDEIKIFRESIVTDLEDPRIQFNYLIGFLKICEKKYRTCRKDDISWLKFLATAYNYGIDKSEEQIINMIDRKFFNTKLFKTENYSYADVSLYWYLKFNADK
jgi:hypothetical protein